VNHINRLWHATAMGADYDELLGPLQRLFGAAVMHDHVSDAPGIGRRGGMIWIGDNSIEIGAPVGEQSPVRNFVEKWGGGMHSIALHVENAHNTAERLGELGLTPQAWLDDHIFFSKPRESCGLLLEWSDRHTDDDPRWGFSPEPLPQPPVVPALQYGFVTAVVNDPPSVAERLAALFGTEILRLRRDAAPDQIGAIVSLGDCLLLLFPMPLDGSSVELWGSDIDRNRFHAHGLRVADLADALRKLEAHGVRQTATIDGMAYLDPAALPIPTFLVQDLLPEDPRRTAA
jgi:hypothetical protein